MLFVDDDEAEVFDGREDGGAGADDDAGFAVSNTVPLLGALLGGEGGVEQSDVGGEGVMQLRGHGGGEADLGDEEDGGFSLVESAAHGGEIDGGLAGAGDAVEQMRAEFGGFDRGGDGVEGGLLGVVEGVLGARQPGEMREVEVRGAVFDADEVALDQRGERGRGNGEAAELGDGELVGGSSELGEDGLLVVVELRQAGSATSTA